MASHYTGDPTSSPKDAVRFLCGDVLRSDYLRTDEEYAFALTEGGANLYRAAALICDSLASQFAREADKSVGEERTQLSQRSRAFAARAAEMRDRAATGASGLVLAAPFLGGASMTRESAERADADFPQPAIRTGQFDHPGLDAEDCDAL